MKTYLLLLLGIINIVFLLYNLHDIIAMDSRMEDTSSIEICALGNFIMTVICIALLNSIVKKDIEDIMEEERKKLS